MNRYEILKNPDRVPVTSENVKKTREKRFKLCHWDESDCDHYEFRFENDVPTKGKCNASIKTHKQCRRDPDFEKGRMEI